MISFEKSTTSWKVGFGLLLLAGLLAACGSSAKAQGLRSTFGDFDAGVPATQAMARANWALTAAGFQPSSYTSLSLSANRGEYLSAVLSWTQTASGVQVHLTVVGNTGQDVVWNDYHKIQAQFLNPTQTNEVKASFNSTVGRGQRFSLAYAVPLAYSQTGFFAMTYTDSPNWRGRFSYQKVQGASGTVELQAPAAPGVYHIRFYAAEQPETATPVATYQITVQ